MLLGADSTITEFISKSTGRLSDTKQTQRFEVTVSLRSEQRTCRTESRDVPDITRILQLVSYISLGPLGMELGREKRFETSVSRDVIQLKRICRKL